MLPFGPDDGAAIASFVELANAVKLADSPWQPPWTARRAEGRFRHGWDGEVEQAFLASADGVTVAVGTLSTSDYDNLNLAWLGVMVHPEHRRQGHGSAMLDHLLAEAEALGRTSIGIDGWESEATRAFAARHGFAEKSRAVQRHQVLADVDWDDLRRLHDDASAAASDYELARRVGPTPDDELGALAELTAAINDAPTDDLDIEDEVYPPERVRAYEEAQVARGFRLYRVVARHRPSGELAGHTVVTVDAELPRLADQHDTAVLGTHRGHRLGLLLKTEMNLWLREVEPQLEVLSTWNAESNDHMIGVNERIGYRFVGRELEFQRSL